MKVVFILHNIQKSFGIEWLTSGLLDNGFNLSFILINKEHSEMEAFLDARNVEVKRLAYGGKKEAPLFLYKLYRELSRIKPDAVHTHLRDADLYGQTAAFLCGIKKRIFTRHIATFHHMYHKKSVLIDRFINTLATDIIAISEVTRQVLVKMEGVNENKVKLIHHGFDLESFDTVDEGRVNLIKAKHGIPDNKIIIGVFARYTELKGYQYIIPALSRLAETNPNLHFIFANTVGEYAVKIKNLLTHYLPAHNYTEIRFESDIQGLYKVLNFYIHAPINNMIEAFGQTYVESLAAGIPSVFTLSGVANEFIVNEKNALVVDYKNSDEIYTAMQRLIANKELCQKLIANGKQDVKQFNLDSFIKKSIAVYQ